MISKLFTNDIVEYVSKSKLFTNAMKYISKHGKELNKITDYEIRERVYEIARSEFYYSLYRNSEVIDVGLDYISSSYEGMTFSLFDYTLDNNKIVGRGTVMHDISTIV